MCGNICVDCFLIRLMYENKRSYMSDILQLCNKNTICNITKAVIVELNIVKILCVKDYFKGLLDSKGHIFHITV